MSFHRLVARSPASHAGDRGSTPRGSTKDMGLIRPAVYECDQCSVEFAMFILWDWVYAQAVGVDPEMYWDFVAYTYKKVGDKWLPDYSHGMFRAGARLDGVLCEGCVEQNIGRKLYWWDYMFIAGNFSDVNLDFFLPVKFKDE